MDLIKLDKRLKSERFPADTYSLDGSTPKYADGAYILVKENSTWIIQLIDRGVRMQKFASQSEAETCAEFYRLMKRDISY